MKKILLSAFALMFVSKISNAQCNELFFSEYVEGSNFNKALEIYNPTAVDVSLDNYRVVRYDNGSTAAGGSQGDGILDLTGENLTVPAHGVVVLVLNTSTQGVEIEPDAALAALADAQFGTSCIPGAGVVRALCFNGDDALTLEKNIGGAWTKVDIFASIGDRPTNGQGTFSPTGGWTDSAPYNTGVGAYWTIDQTLVRKSSVTTGVSSNPAAGIFNPSSQWDSLPENTFSELGTHNCSCNTSSIKEKSREESTTYLMPNPAAENVRIQSANYISKVVVTDIIGREVFATTSFATHNLYLNVTSYKAGIYNVSVFFESGKVVNRKLVKE